MKIKNARIFTSDRERLYADSMITDGEKIVWIGAEKDAPESMEDARDMGGKRIIPGMIDAHEHPIGLANNAKQIAVLPPNVNSIEDLKARIREVREKQGPGKWILGWGYDEGKLAEHRAPNRRDLDEACSDSPVLLIRSCVHMVAVNSKALELAGIDRDTPDPAGGRIDRDENGEPNGILRETANHKVRAMAPTPGFEQEADNLVDLGRRYSSQGLVAVCDMGNLDGGNDYKVVERAIEKGFKQRYGLYYIWDYARKDPSFDIPEELTKGGRQLKISGLKLVADGSISGRTCWVDEPFKGEPAGDYGIYTISDESLETAIEFCKKRCLQLSAHAMGGRTIAKIIDRVANEKKWTSGTLPHVRMEHITEPREDSIEKAAASGIAFAVQPIFLYCEIESYLDNLGAERVKRACPVKHMLDKGVKLCLSTDSPATSWADPSDPFVNIKAACTRKAYNGVDEGEDQKIDVETALILYTAEAAEIAGFEGLGKLSPGFEASFVVLDKDIIKTAPMEIDTVKVEETYIRGERVY